MRIINTILNTQPLIVHAQGGAHKTTQWFSLLNDVVPGQQPGGINFPDLDKISIVSFTYGYMATALDRQLKKAGIPFVNLATHYNHTGLWRNSFKIKYLFQYLYEIDTPYVLELDSIDVLIADDMTGLIERFEKKDCDILYGASIQAHPPENKTAEDKNAIWKYLNAGTMMGKIEPLKKFYEVLNVDIDNPVDRYVNNEQGIIREVRKQFERIKADTGCQLFQTLSCCQYSYKNGVVSINSLKH